MSELAIKPTHLCRCEYAVKGNPPSQDNSIILCYRVSRDEAGGVLVSLPVAFPSDAKWLVQVMATQGQFVFGIYRRHMKTIGYLGQIDKLYGAPATTRNWNTIVAILRILKGQKGTR